MIPIKVYDERPVFPIRIAAELLGISIHTLRIYERAGLLIPSKSVENQRLYSIGEIEMVIFF
ncbi:MAG: MerR family DNA-binding transcriptional regulator [Bacteroidetes bacterium]|nr:MerR family DNA-binding transcriptional regulator [Bacteroidota bacterium]MCH7769555.1 MerR family DNA-binding transcriptional regulator [Bacteroidota bacterium]